MRIRIENLDAKNLVHVIVGLGSQVYLLKKDKLEKLREKAINQNDEMSLNFITEYGTVAVETVIKFKSFCDQYYRIDCVIVGGSVLYGYSQWRGSVEQVVIEAE